MKISGRLLSCYAALFFALTSVSAVQQKLDSINDLKKLNFGQSVPKHSLVLLYWFANTVDLNNNNIIRLTFDPNSDYVSRHYGNYEGLLEPLPLENGHGYYTVGNLQERAHQESSMQLPDYVVHPPRREYVGRNRDRILFRVTGQNRVDQVYMTQHNEHGNVYDPDNTYPISPNLLREIREFSVGQNQQSLLGLRNRYGSDADDSHIRKTWGDLAGLGLLLFIVIQERCSSSQRNNRRGKRQNHSDDDASESESESNVPRGFHNQDYVAVRVNNETDQTGSRGSGRPFCYICCICCFVAAFILFCILLIYLFTAVVL